MFTEYEPGSYLPYISPTPLLLLVAAGDHLVPAELAIAAYDTAHEPKKLVILPGGHFDAYVKGFDAGAPGPRLVRPAPGALRPRARTAPRHSRATQTLPGSLPFVSRGGGTQGDTAIRFQSLLKHRPDSSHSHRLTSSRMHQVFAVLVCARVSIHELAGRQAALQRT